MSAQLAAPKKPALTARQESFARAYATHFNASRAAIQAGYSKATAFVTGTQVKALPQVQARIAELLEPHRREFEVTRERTLLELARIAYADIRELYDENGQLRPIHELEDHVAATIASVEEERRTEGRGEDAVDIRTKKVKTHDKMKALEMLSKHLQLYSDAANVVVQNNTVNVGDLANLPPEERDALRRLLELRAQRVIEHR